MEYEYCENPSDNKPNENDIKYLEYCELLMQAKEFGVGYRVEFEDTLYLAPTPLVKINAQNTYHSINGPAIKWKGADEYFYLNGVNFPKELYKKATSGALTLKDLMGDFKDIDQRTQALRFCKPEVMISHAKGVLIDEVTKLDIHGGAVNWKLYKFPQGEIFSTDAYYCLMDCPSTGKQHFEGVEVSKTVAEAMSWAESNEFVTVTPEEWSRRVPLLHEN